MKEAIKYITTEELNTKLREVKPGAVFSISYYSKKDDTVVTRNGQRGIIKYLKGVGKGYSDADKGLFTYYDTMKASYRSPRMENIRRVKIGGVTFKLKS